MSSSYIIQDKRWLLKFFAAKSPWTVLIFLVPLMLALAGLILLEDAFSLSKFLLLVPLSILYWSFVEYAIHRWYFHFVPKNRWLRYLTGSFHLYHHEHPSDLEVINSGWVTGLLGVLFHFSVFHWLFRASYLNALYLTLALCLVYYFYEWVHYFVHQKVYARGLMRYLQNFHLTHHVRPKTNYGQITPLWDYVLGTAKENLETKDHGSMLRLIKGGGKQ